MCIKRENARNTLFAHLQAQGKSCAFLSLCWLSQMVLERLMYSYFQTGVFAPCIWVRLRIGHNI